MILVITTSFVSLSALEDVIGGSCCRQSTGSIGVSMDCCSPQSSVSMSGGTSSVFRGVSETALAVVGILDLMVVEGCWVLEEEFFEMEVFFGTLVFSFRKSRQSCIEVEGCGLFTLDSPFFDLAFLVQGGKDCGAKFTVGADCCFL